MTNKGIWRIGVLLAAVIVMAPGAVSAECLTTGQKKATPEVREREWRVHGTTPLITCQGAEINVWLDKPNATCIGGWMMVPGNVRACQRRDYAPTAEAAATVYLRGYCGYAVGSSWHLALVPGTTTVWEDHGTFHAELLSTCPPPPEDPGCAEWQLNGDYQWYCYESPIIIPVGQSQAYKLTSIDDGVVFDINADGRPDRVSWTEAGSNNRFLAIDWNGNGRIDDGAELIGNHTVKGARNGFEALLMLYQEAKGTGGNISEDTPALYAKLLLWDDANHNGQSEASELEPFAKYFSDMDLAWKEDSRRDGHGNLFAYQGFVKERTKPGRNRVTSADDVERRSRKVYDVYLMVERPKQ